MTLQPDSQLYAKLCNPPSNVSLPSSTLTNGTGIAKYDSSLSAPFCQGVSNSCDSSNLLAGRATEANAPNTIDKCSDGNDSTVTYTESVKRISVSSVNGNGLRGGDLVKIQATVISFAKLDRYVLQSFASNSFGVFIFSLSFSEHNISRVDYYFTSNAASPDWKFITTVAPLIGETNVTVPNTRFPDVRYILPQCLSVSGCKQAVR
jgi:hypothetical protein